MEKLNKENIYINLQGKSEEELTGINNILDYFKQVKRRDNITEYFNECYDCFNYLHFYNNEWLADTDFFYLKEKQEVTIQQLKEILQPMDNKEFDLKGYSVEVDNEMQAKQLQEYAFKQGFKWRDGEKVCLLDRKFFNFNVFNENMIHCDSIHFKDEYVTKEIHFKDIFKTNPLQEQLEKAKAEVKRLEDEIEESKIKVGDWVVSSLNYCIFKYEFGRLKDDLTKITDQDLINKLNELIK